MTSAYAPARRMRLSVVGEPSDEPLPCVSDEPPPEPHAVMLSAIVAASAPASNLRFMIFPPIITLWNSLFVDRCGKAAVLLFFDSAA